MHYYEYDISSTSRCIEDCYAHAYSRRICIMSIFVVAPQTRSPTHVATHTHTELTSCAPIVSKFATEVHIWQESRSLAEAMKTLVILFAVVALATAAFEFTEEWELWKKVC